MGIPIASRNIFPSNIQGLPTWFEVRVSGEGHLGRRGGVDLMVAMNPQTWDRDIAEIDAGGYLLYDNTRPMPASRFRADINVIGVPLTAALQRRLHRCAAAPAAQEHHVCRRALGPAQHRAAGGRAAAGRAVQGQGEAGQAEPRRLPHGPRLGAEEPRLPDRPDARNARTRSATASMSRAMPPPRSARSMAARRSAPGTRSPPPPRWPRPSSATASASAPSRRRARSATPSSRPRTSWPPSASSSAPPGTARGPSPRPPAPASP